jgi:PiT family inorganic phosphate transporter
LAALILLAVVLLAYGNGANDNFKGVATLFGSGTADYRRALVWASLATLAGALLALVLADGLVAAFKGKGLVPDAVTRNPDFLLAVASGAGLTVLTATLAGLPISTTHALIGGLVGAGLAANGGQLHVSALLSTFVLPLLCSPLLAMASTLALYPLACAGGSVLGISDTSCLCVDAPSPALAGAPAGAPAAAAARAGSPALSTGSASECAASGRGRVLALRAGAAFDALHYLSAGAVCFARGLNDAPKIVALLIAAEALAPTTGLAVVAGAMVLGGLVTARKVAETMSRRITSMTPGQGLAGNLVTAALVILASRSGLPVSTTHVSVGALFGVGVASGGARRGTIAAILGAWLATLPLAAALAALTYWVRAHAT